MARCSVSYSGRGATELPEAVRLIMLKRDGSVCLHADDRAYKPLNWMLPPCSITVTPGESPGFETWVVAGRQERLEIRIREVLSDTQHDLEDSDPGLVRSWTERHIQAWLATHLEEVLGPGWTLQGREYQTGQGPVDLLVRDPRGVVVAVEVKRTATMNAVDQVGRYVSALTREFGKDVRGLVIALAVKPRAREVAEERGIDWLEIPATMYRS